MTRTLSSAMALACLLVAGGCSSDPSAGDTGVARDARVRLDAQASEEPDAAELVDAGSTGPDVGTAEDAAVPDVDATVDSDAAEPEFDASAGVDAAQAGTDAAQAGTDAAQPGTDAAQPGTDAAQPGTDAAQAGADAAQAGADAAQPAGDAGATVVSCGDGVCSFGETCTSCPTECGTCPPLLAFHQGWTTTFSAPIVAGRQVSVAYDLDRLTDCRGTHNGFPAWGITLHYKFDSTGTVVDVPVSATNSLTNTVEPVAALIDVPAGVGDLWMWFENWGLNCTSGWDSNLNANYQIPVFEAAALAAPLGWVGDFNFVYQGKVSDVLRGDIDPAYYFASMAGSELATRVQVEVWAPGITDRTYQNDGITAEVARTALSSAVLTDARPGSSPGQPLQLLPLPYKAKSGNNFVYAWNPDGLTWSSAWTDGAYSYRFELRGIESSAVSVVEKTSAPGTLRTFVLAKTTSCGLFPYNPPLDYCP